MHVEDICWSLVCAGSGRRDLWTFNYVNRYGYVCLWKLWWRFSWTLLPYPLTSTFSKKYLPVSYSSGSIKHMTLLLEKNPECIFDEIESTTFQHFHMLLGFFGSAGRAQTLAVNGLVIFKRRPPVPSWGSLFLKRPLCIFLDVLQMLHLYMKTSCRYEICTSKCASIHHWNKSLCVW